MSKNNLTARFSFRANESHFREEKAIRIFGLEGSGFRGLRGIGCAVMGYMKTSENMNRALQSAGALLNDLVSAHRDAINDGDGMAEILLLNKISQASELKSAIMRMASTIKP
jgi:hypothetical protein